MYPKQRAPGLKPGHNKSDVRRKSFRYPGMRKNIIALPILACVLGTLAHASPAKRPIGVDDLVLVRTPSQVSLSPDGRNVAYMLATPNLENNNHTHDLYIVAADGKGKPRRLVAGEAQSGELASFLQQSPTWAPQSDRLVYVMPKGEGTEIRTVDVTTGTSEALVSQDLVGKEFSFTPSYFGPSLSFSPDGHWLAFLGSRKPPEPKDEKLTTAIAADEDWAPRDKQYMRDMYQLFAMNLRSREVIRLTDANISIKSFDWSPDSKRLAISAYSDVTNSANYLMTDIYIIDVSSRQVRPLVTTPGMDEQPKWSPDGQWIAFGSQRGKEDWMYTTTISVVAADGSSAPRYIGERELNRVSGSQNVPVRWTADGKFVDTQAAHDLSTHLFRVSVEDGSARRITPRADRHYEDFSYSRDGKRVAMIAQGVGVPPEVFVADADTMNLWRVTDCNPEWQQLRVPLVERMTWRSPDGKWELKGLLIKPSTFEEGRKYPLLTNILGGPSMVRQELNPAFNYPLLVLAEREGYVIFMPNSRGRAGSGLDFTHAIRDEQSYVLNPMSDVLAGVDVLVERGIADPKRLGLLGFSYGGTLTSYIVTTTDRFRAAIYGEGSPNILGDIQRYGRAEFLGLNRDMWGFGNPFEPSEIKRAYEQSAVYRLDKVKTPVLIEAGEKSAWESDRQFYRGLKHFGVPSEFWIYPRSGHGWDEPLLKQDAFNRHIAWFDYWLKGKPYPDKKKQAEYDAWRR